MIRLGLAGQNLTIRPIAGASERQDREKINLDLKCSKIPIYKADLFLYHEIPKSSLPQIFSLWQESEIVVEEKAKQVIEDYKFSSIPLAELPIEEILINPANPKYEWRDWQEEFVAIDYRKEALGIVLDCGSGKCLGMLGRMANQGFKRCVVMTVIDNFSDWKVDIENMFGSSKSFVVYDGTKPQRDKINLDVDIIITNYEKVKEIKEKVTDFDYLILDEVHMTLNPDSKGFKVVKTLCNKKGLKKLASTATPIESRLDELWGLFHLLNPNLVGPRDKFLNKFQEVLRYKNITYTRGGREFTYQVPIKTRVKNLPALRELMSTLIFRVDTTQHFNFDDPTEIVTLDITPKQQIFYDAAVEDVDMEMTKVLRCMQVADGLYNLDASSRESAKLEWARNFIEEKKKTGGKVIFWDCFIEVTNILGEDYKDCLVVMNGEKSKTHKKLARMAFAGCRNEAEKEEFYKLLAKNPDFPFKEPGTAQFLASTFGRGAGVGMNILTCDCQVFFALGQSGRSFHQASKRIKRPNSPFKVIKTFILCTKRTLEPKYTIHVLDKIKKAGQILDGDDTILDSKLSEIVAIIRDNI